MQDGSKSESRALNKVFDQVTILMCYFHVIENCKKHLVKQQHETMLSDVKYLHESTHLEEFNERKYRVIYKWNIEGLVNIINKTEVNNAVFIFFLTVYLYIIRILLVILQHNCSIVNFAIGNYSIDRLVIPLQIYVNLLIIILRSKSQIQFLKNVLF